MELLLLAQGQAQGANPLFSMLPMLLILGIFYFLLILPHRKQQREHTKLVAELQRGDQVTTMGGVVGTITEIKDDIVTLRSGQSTLLVERSRVARKIVPPADKKV